VIVILLALALICDNPTPTLLKAAPTAAREVCMSEALWMYFLSWLSIIGSVVLIVLCVKGGAMPRVVQRVVQRGGKTPPPPDLPKLPMLGLPERPSPPTNTSKEGKAKDAFECSNCGHRYSEAEIIERLNPCIQCGGKDIVKVVE